MKGQAREMIPAVIGIIALLLIGITGYVVTSGEKQAINIAETHAVTLDEHRKHELTEAFRAEADKAAMQNGAEIASDLAMELQLSQEVRVARAVEMAQEQG